MSKLACGHPVECEESSWLPGGARETRCLWCVQVESMWVFVGEIKADIARAVEAEREACAKVAENNKVGSRSGESELVSVRAHNFASDDIAAAIRARGNDARERGTE